MPAAEHPNNANKPSLTPIFVFVFLAVVTVSCHTFVDQYEQSGSEMLADDWHLRGIEKGGAGGNDAGFLLFAADPKKNVSMEQKIRWVDQGVILKLSADMKCRNVQPGKKPWHLARLLLVQQDGHKNRWDFPHLVASLTGTRDWETYSQYFTMGPTTKTIRVVGQLSQSTGSFWLKNIHLYPVTQTEIYSWIKTAILVSWGLFSVFLLGSCFFYGNRKSTLQVMLVFAFIAIIIGTTMPGSMKNLVFKQVATQIHAASDTFSKGVTNLIEPAVAPYMSKAGHFCFFVLFGLALSLLMTRESGIIVMTHILLLAGATELAQFYVDGRSPMVGDFAIDALGGLWGMILMKFSSMRTRSI